MSTAIPTFDPSVIASILTTHLLSVNGIQGVYEILNYMTGEPVFTHQIPRCVREAQPVLEAALPEVAAWVKTSGYESVDGPETHKVWIASVNEYWKGRTFEVPRMGINQHESIDPVSELAEKVHPRKIMIVDPKG